jgi:hypothetical protein
LLAPVRHRSGAGFTLAELIVATGVLTVLGGIAYIILNTGLILFAKNYGLNQTHHDGVYGVEKTLTMLQSAVEAPQLVDNTGAVVAGNGPSAGLLFRRPASYLPYQVNGNVNATDVAFTLSKQISSQPAPKAGDTIQISELGFKAQVVSVSSAGTNTTVNFASTVGTYFTTPITSGTAIPGNSRAFLISQSALISVGSDLRFYSDANNAQLSVNPSAFNNSSNFSVISHLTPLSGSSESLPFEYTDTTRRLVDVTLRVQSRDYSNRGFNSLNTFLNMRTSIAYRSAAL